MSEASEQATVRILRIGTYVIAQDIRKLPSRDLSRVGAWRFDLGEDDAEVGRFYDAMQDHLSRIAQLHNAKLPRRRKSARYVALQQEMRAEVRQVIGDAPFECFKPTLVDEELSATMDSEDVKGKAMWACFWIVDALDVLVQEHYAGAEELIGNYHQALFEWWRLVEACGFDAIDAALGKQKRITH